MSDYETLDKLLGKTVVGYAYPDRGEELALKFDDGTIVEWWGYHNYPSNPQSDGTTPQPLKERLDGEWVELDE